MAERTSFIQGLQKGESLISVFGAKTFLTIHPVPGIDKVKFEIVEKGSGGKGVKFWMPLEAARELAEDIDSGVFVEKIAKDAQSQEQYHAAYSYVTGVDGCDRLTISAGQKGILVQISNKRGDQADRKSVVVAAYNGISPFKEYAFMLSLVLGLIPVTPGTYYDQVVKAFYAGEKERAAKAAEAAAAKAPAQAPAQAAPVQDPIPGGGWQRAADNIPFA